MHRLPSARLAPATGTDHWPWRRSSPCVAAVSMPLPGAPGHAWRLHSRSWRQACARPGAGQGRVGAQPPSPTRFSGPGCTSFAPPRYFGPELSTLHRRPGCDSGAALLVRRRRPGQHGRVRRARGARVGPGVQQGAQAAHVRAAQEARAALLRGCVLLRGRTGQAARRRGRCRTRARSLRGWDAALTTPAAAAPAPARPFPAVCCTFFA